MNELKLWITFCRFNFKRSCFFGVLVDSHMHPVINLKLSLLRDVIKILFHCLESNQALVSVKLVLFFLSTQKWVGVTPVGFQLTMQKVMKVILFTDITCIMCSCGKDFCNCMLFTYFNTEFWWDQTCIMVQTLIISGNK